MMQTMTTREEQELPLALTPTVCLGYVCKRTAAGDASGEKGDQEWFIRTPRGFYPLLRALRAGPVLAPNQVVVEGMQPADLLKEEQGQPQAQPPAAAKRQRTLEDVEQGFSDGCDPQEHVLQWNRIRSDVKPELVGQYLQDYLQDNHLVGALILETGGDNYRLEELAVGDGRVTIRSCVTGGQRQVALSGSEIVEHAKAVAVDPIAKYFHETHDQTIIQWWDAVRKDCLPEKALEVLLSAIKDYFLEGGLILRHPSKYPDQGYRYRLLRMESDPDFPVVLEQLGPEGNATNPLWLGRTLMDYEPVWIDREYQRRQTT